MVCVRLSLESFAVVPVVSAPTVAPASPPTAVAEATTAEAASSALAAEASDRDQACSRTDTEGESVLALVLPYTTNFCAYKRKSCSISFN
jgi:hypothetical protein